MIEIAEIRCVDGSARKDGGGSGERAWVGYLRRGAVGWPWRQTR